MVITVAFLVLSALLLISAYVSRLYTESGKFLSREFQENIELFEHQIEPRLGFKRERAALSFALLEQLLTASICFLLAYSVFAQPGWTVEEAVQAVFFVIIVILIFDRFLPYLLFSRTRGGWLVRFTLLLRLLVWSVIPLTLVLGFLQSVTTLTTLDGEWPWKQSISVQSRLELLDRRLQWLEDQTAAGANPAPSPWPEPLNSDLQPPIPPQDHPGERQLQRLVRQTAVLHRQLKSLREHGWLPGVPHL